jgi:preprotein translocase subunit SecY
MLLLSSLGHTYVWGEPQTATILISPKKKGTFIGGMALFIVVVVALDTASQVETHIITRNYEGFMKRGRLRVRRG